MSTRLQAKLNRNELVLQTRKEKMGSSNFSSRLRRRSRPSCVRSLILKTQNHYVQPDGTELEWKDVFKYLGSSFDRELNIRLFIATNESILFYGCDSWTLRET